MNTFHPAVRRSLFQVAAGLAICSAWLLASSCNRAQKNAQTQPTGPAEVGVVTITPTAVTLSRELPGRTSAFRVAEVRARVSGIVLKRLFEEGSDVKEGQVLYQIDPAPYQAAVDSAKAQLARAEAAVSSARAQADRVKALVDSHAVSRQQYDDAIAALMQAEADVQAGKAGVQTADINLGYTRVTSPVSGRIGRSEVTEGAYVQQGTATLLATVQQLDPLYVDLTQASSEALRLKRAFESGRLQKTNTGKAQVKLLLEDGSVYAEDGTLEFADVTVNPSTSSITLRAVFPNAHADLMPGMFVRARLTEGVSPSAILVPQQAVSRNNRGEAVALVVGADNKVESRTLRTDRAIGAQWLVTEGLKAGDQVIVDNLQKIRPGAAVKPVPTSIQPDTTRSTASVD